MSIQTEEKLPKMEKLETDYRRATKAFLEQKGYGNMMLKGSGQNLTDPTEYAFEWGSAEKEGREYTLMVTRAAREGYDPNKLPQGLLLHQQRFVSEGTNEFLQKQGIQARLLSTRDVYDVDENVSVAVQERLSGRFLGNQRTLQLDRELPKHFPILSNAFHSLNRLQPKDAPRQLLKLARNYPELRESFEEMKERMIKKALERLAALSGDIHDDKKTKIVETMISGYTPDTGFNLFDRAPWTTAVGNDNKLVFTNYWWSGFRDKYYDPIYFFVKTWGHAGNERFAKQWLETYLMNGFSTQERGAFESQFWGMTATRLVQDLAESKNYATQDQFLRYKNILNRLCKKSLKEFLP